MAPPPHDEVMVACDALRSDATKWTTASDAMAVAAGSAKNLVLGKDQFGWAGDQRGVVTAYQALQDKIAGLLTGADAEFDKIAVVLRVSADTYEREDAEGAHRLDQAGN